jgi:hypothetical protein
LGTGWHCWARWAAQIIEKHGSGWAMHSGVGRENMSWRKKGSWAAINKERGELGCAGLQQRKKMAGARENQPTASFGYKNTFSIYKYIFQFVNHLEFKSSLNFDDFYSHNKMETLHQHKKKICNSMKCNNQIYNS